VELAGRRNGAGMEIPSSSAVISAYEKPFRHLVIENLVSQDLLQVLNAQWPADQWMKEQGKNQHKWSTSNLPSIFQEVTNAITPSWVSQLVGIPDLIADPDLFGAGLHCIPLGGFLRMHVDFNQHPKGWHRRVNFLLYLNETWEEEWEGALILGKAKDVSYFPIGGRAVVFETNDLSWHGHPERLVCPDNIQRRSLALYFYTQDPPKTDPHTTVYLK
jgi:2OG-Fe(II) oxygenase superfamily